MIRLQNIHKTFEIPGQTITALAGVDLTIDEGEIYGIVGYSGAGKSTLIRLLNGLERPTSGSVHLRGRELTQLREGELKRLRPKIGMIFQHFNLLWSRTVAQNIAFPLQIAGLPRTRIKARVAELIALVELDGRESAYPSQLSGGQKQRVGIARALANEPEVLLCDEATSALDPQTTDTILDLLKDINARLGLTIVLITHEMHVVERICHKVAVMDAGRVVEEGDTASVFAHPREEITRRFVRRLADTENEVGPFEMVDGLGVGVIVRLAYAGANAQESALAEAIARFSLPINVLHGKITPVRNALFGDLYVHMPTTPGGIEPVLAFFAERGIEPSVIRRIEA
jgi:D-methionine transport system ATP-binding protein